MSNKSAHASRRLPASLSLVALIAAGAIIGGAPQAKAQDSPVGSADGLAKDAPEREIVVGGSVSDPDFVVIAHAIQGVGIAVPTLCMGLVREHVSVARVPVAIAIVTTITTATAPIFFLLAGYIMDHYSWRWTFLIGVVII